MTGPFDFTADTFDSRDVIERIEELQALTPDEGTPETSVENVGERYMTDDEAEELTKLLAFASEAQQYVSDWQYGETFIAERYFGDYARELAEDIGAIDADAPWPIRHIDWSAAADELRQDYTELELDGRPYLVRASSVPTAAPLTTAQQRAP